MLNWKTLQSQKSAHRFSHMVMKPKLGWFPLDLPGQEPPPSSPRWEEHPTAVGQTWSPSPVLSQEAWGSLHRVRMKGAGTAGTGFPLNKWAPQHEGIFRPAEGKEPAERSHPLCVFLGRW